MAAHPPHRHHPRHPARAPFATPHHAHHPIQHPHRQWLHRLHTLNTACEQHINQLRTLQTTLRIRARWTPAAHDAVHVITHEINQLDHCRTPLATLLDQHTIERTA